MSPEFRMANHEAVIRKSFRWLITIGFVAAYLLVLARLWWPIRLPGTLHWPGAVLLLLAVANTLIALARNLPGQNVLFAAMGIALSAGVIEWLNTKTGIPFGLRTFGAVGPKIFSTLPWAIPLIWIVAILNSRGVGRLILRPWRKTRTYGYRLIGVTTVLTALFDFSFEPFATQARHFWFWEPTRLPVSWQGAPLVNFFSWAVVTLLILAFITPLLINKQLSKHRSPDFHPLMVWLGAILLFAAGAGIEKMWSAVAVDCAIGTVTAIFAVRGARW